MEGSRARGLGYGSRFCVSATDLPPGWRRERRSDKYTVWFDENGTRYKSSREVEAALRCRFSHVQAAATAENKHASEEDTLTETGGETSEFELSPAKRPRIDA